MKLGHSACFHGLDVSQVETSNNIIIRPDMFRNEIHLEIKIQTSRCAFPLQRNLLHNHRIVQNLLPANNDDTWSDHFQLEDGD